MVKPVVVVLNLTSEDYVVFDPNDKDLSLGKSRWLPGSNTELVFVGYNSLPRKLGFIYCVNKRYIHVILESHYMYMHDCMYM